jgi:hypothetical protein
MEMAHSLLRDGGRLGLIVPSGVYSDYGTAELRTLFLDRCRWEWLFGFENREGIFDIHRSFKFNPMIIQKGGVTDRIQTAFMRRDLRDWEQAEKHVTEYPRERVLQFSPRSKAILEIQSQRDLEVLEKIYSNGVLLGDQSPDGWGIKYAQGDFNMTSDSKLFPPRDKWEERGYRPDEYSRWLRGKWRSIQELYAELGVKPLAEGEVRDAQPQYAHLPIPRADIPAGVILSRDGQSYLLETEIDTDEFLDIGNFSAIAAPLYEGRLFNQFDYSQKRWLSGSGLNASWEEVDSFPKDIDPHYLMLQGVASSSYRFNRSAKLIYRNIARDTDTRTFIGTTVCGDPVPHVTSILNPKSSNDSWFLTATTNSLVFDHMVRTRLTGTHLDYHVVREFAIPRNSQDSVAMLGLSLGGAHSKFAAEWLRMSSIIIAKPWKACMALTPHERLRRRIIIEVLIARSFALDEESLRWILRDCDLAPEEIIRRSAGGTLHERGFWRVDKSLPSELRLPVLAFVLFMQAKNESNESICDWQIPEEIDLVEYGLGDGSGGRVEVRSRFGPRYFGWQESQGVEESWRECHLHARNLLGPSGYASLLSELRSPGTSDPGPQSPHPDGLSSVPSVPRASGPRASGPPASGPPANGPPANGPPANGPTASVSSQSVQKPGGMAESFDPDTFTLSNAPVPKKRKKR